jgi:ACS family glucarate transporter-like MFS transporter
MGEAPAALGVNMAIYNWFPKHERGKAVAIFLFGSKLGPVLGIPAATMLMIHFGWRSVFWAFGAFGVLAALLYFLALKTHPYESRFVNKAELEYIYEGQPAAARTQKKELAPWGQFLRSPQVWGIGIQQGTGNFILWVFIAWLPVYLLEAHHFSLKAMGFAAAVPEAAYALGIFLCGAASDYVIGRKIVNSKVKGWFGAAGQLLCCLCVGMTAISEGKAATIFWLSIALAFLGFSFNSAWTSASDLGGRFSGSVSGWMQFVGALIGGVAPIVVAWIASGWGWTAAMLFTGLTGIIGAFCWLFVHPERPLKGSAQQPAPAA